jgi:hypothetical protein
MPSQKCRGIEEFLPIKCPFVLAVMFRAQKVCVCRKPDTDYAYDCKNHLSLNVKPISIPAVSSCIETAKFSAIVVSKVDG